jgi:hypothetical protein
VCVHVYIDMYLCAYQVCVLVVGDVVVYRKVNKNTRSGNSSDGSLFS